MRGKNGPGKIRGPSYDSMSLQPTPCKTSGGDLALWLEGGVGRSMRQLGYLRTPTAWLGHPAYGVRQECLVCAALYSGGCQGLLCDRSEWGTIEKEVI